MNHDVWLPELVYRNADPVIPLFGPLIECVQIMLQFDSLEVPELEIVFYAIDKLSGPL